MRCALPSPFLLSLLSLCGLAVLATCVGCVGAEDGGIDLQRLCASQPSPFDDEATWLPQREAECQRSLRRAVEERARLEVGLDLVEAAELAPVDG